jgi:hypothetical protein
MFQDTLIAAFFAGIVAIIVTVLVEKYGGAIGGILGTIPTTIVPASIGMYLASNIVDFRTSMAVVPSGMLINAIFLTNWKIIPTYFKVTKSKYTTLIIIIVISLFIWLLCSILALNLINFVTKKGLSSYGIALLGFFAVVILGLIFCWNIGLTPSSNNHVNKYALMSRGLMAAFAIGAAVWISDLGYPLIAGIASVFPAIFLTSMVTLWISQGPSVPMGAVGPMMLGGSSVALYSIIAMWSLPYYGLIIGSILAWVSSVLLCSLPSFYYINWRQKNNIY